MNRQCRRQAGTGSVHSEGTFSTWHRAVAPSSAELREPTLPVDEPSGSSSIDLEHESRCELVQTPSISRSDRFDRVVVESPVASGSPRRRSAGSVGAAPGSSASSNRGSVGAPVASREEHAQSGPSTSSIAGGRSPRASDQWRREIDVEKLQPHGVRCSLSSRVRLVRVNVGRRISGVARSTSRSCDPTAFVVLCRIERSTANEPSRPGVVLSRRHPPSFAEQPCPSMNRPGAFQLISNTSLGASWFNTFDLEEGPIRLRRWRRSAGSVGIIGRREHR
jgi:hypothetical protein